MKLHFNKTYFIGFILLFITEALIASFLKTGFIRHTFGDFLVVILVYCFIKSFLKLKPMITGIIVVIIAFSIEILQLLNFLEFLNLQNNQLAQIVLGSTFQVSDLVAYIIGVIFVILVEKAIDKKP